jgi:hypothetical protein
MWERIERWWGRADIATTLLGWLGLWKPITAIAITLGALALGYIQHIPYVYTLAAGALVFAGVFSGINSFDLWISRNSVSDKFCCSTIELRCAAKSSYPTPPLVNYQPGVILLNTSARRIFYRVNEIHSVIGGKGNARPVFDSREGYVDGNTNHVFYYAEIMDVDASTGPIEGTIDFDISFGTSKTNLRYSLKQRRSIKIAWASPDKNLPPSQVLSLLLDN